MVYKCRDIKEWICTKIHMRVSIKVTAYSMMACVYKARHERSSNTAPPSPHIPSQRALHKPVHKYSYPSSDTQQQVSYTMVIRDRNEHKT